MNKICYLCDVKYSGSHIPYCKIATMHYLIDRGLSLQEISKLFPIDKKFDDKLKQLGYDKI